MERDASLSATEIAERRAHEADAARLSAEERARTEAEERAFWERYAAETEATARSGQERQQLLALQATTEAAPATIQSKQKAAADEAAQSIDLDEAATRSLIDARFRAHGWEADSQRLRYAAGTRPMKGRNLAVASGPPAAARPTTLFSSEPHASA